jgi:hypothetical protein
MHNRLRMVTACFLIKDLGIDWRRGEAYFALHLNDFDLASNNGGWQWASSSGCDAQPYFRIFNPITQSEKFDGAEIHPPLPAATESLSDKEIHAPWLAPRMLAPLSAPIVMHDEARKRTLERYAVVKNRQQASDRLQQHILLGTACRSRHSRPVPALVAVLVGAARGDHDDGNMAAALIAAHIARQIETIHARHLDIDQHQVRHAGLQLFQRIHAILGQQHLIALALEQALGHAAHGQRIVHHHACRHLRPPAAAVAVA